MLLGNVEIVSVQPGIFSVTADGQGVANGQFERYTANVFVGVQETFQLIGQYDRSPACSIWSDWTKRFG